jgi:hypothetical protein
VGQDFILRADFQSALGRMQSGPQAASLPHTIVAGLRVL